jgi:hypothetical protein
VLAFGTNPNTVSTAGTTFGTGANLLPANITFTADGVSSYVVQALAGAWYSTTGTASVNLSLVLDGAQSVFMGSAYVPANQAPVPFAYQGVVTPAQGSHTVNVRLYCSAGTAKVLALTDFSAATPILVTVALL